MVTIYEAIESVVDKINETKSLNLIFGSAKEVQQTLVEWSKSPSKKNSKYPCLIVFTPITVPREQSERVDDGVVAVDMVIVTNTKKTYKVSKRIEMVYEPVLWPLYELLIETIKLSDKFDNPSNGLIAHQTTDRFYYSPTPAADQNVFAAVLDAIEINDMELKLRVLNKCL